MNPVKHHPEGWSKKIWTRQNWIRYLYSYRLFSIIIIIIISIIIIIIIISSSSSRLL